MFCSIISTLSAPSSVLQNAYTQSETFRRLMKIQYSISEINSGTLIQADSREPVTLKARLCGILTAGLSGITTHVHGFYTFHFNKSKN
ncbi:PipA/GogA/GtgA family type III secretion system effector [Salmonella enterica subsp. diarizonae serovar 16:z10:e,n,x,z15]